MSEKLFLFVISGFLYLSLTQMQTHRHTDLTDLLSPASTKNCPWGLQKMLLACCLSNISVEKGQSVTFSGDLKGVPDCAALVSIGQLVCLLTYELNLAVVFDMIEGDADSGNLSMENSKLAAVGFPCKCYDAFCKVRNTTHNRSGFFLSMRNNCCYIVCLLSSYPSSPRHQLEPASLSCGRFQSL